jgi:SAM-dependent methyltransferase
MENNKTTYRTSHSEKGYGELYQETYRYGYYATLWNKVEKPLIETIFTEISEQGASSCLDFACGTGRITKVAEDIFDEVTGVDISSEMLKVARQQLTSATLIEQDITTTPLSSEYDVISSFRFFLNAESELRISTLKTLHGLLSDQGTLIINVHVNKHSPLGIIYRARNLIARRTVANTLGWGDFSNYLTKAGFTVQYTQWYGYYPRTGWLLGPLARIFLKPFEQFCKAIKLVPKQWAQNFIVVCKKT